MIRAATSHTKPMGPFFVKGPMDWRWLCATGRVPGKALHVAVTLYLLMGLRKGTSVKLGRKHLSEIGVSRYAAYRALKAMERAGLVAVVRQRGSAPTVTILPVRQEDS